MSNIKETTRTMNSQDTAKIETQAPAYEPPRIISHSAEHLEGMTIDVNACNSAFGGRRASTSDSQDTSAVVY